MTIQEPSEVRDSFIIIDQSVEEEAKVQPRAAKPKVASLERKSRSPYRIRDPSPVIAQKDINEEEGLGPLPTSPKHNRLSTLPSVNTLKQIETIKLAIREEKKESRQLKATKQQLLS